MHATDGADMSGERNGDLMHRYQIQTSKPVEPGETYMLEQALARTAVRWAQVVRGIEVSGSGGGSGGRGFVIDMDVVGAPARAKVEGERLFAAAWYDAFGLRGSNHVGSLAEDLRLDHDREVVA